MLGEQLRPERLDEMVGDEALEIVIVVEAAAGQAQLRTAALAAPVSTNGVDSAASRALAGTP